MPLLRLPVPLQLPAAGDAAARPITLCRTAILGLLALPVKAARNEVLTRRISPSPTCRYHYL